MKCACFSIRILVSRSEGWKLLIAHAGGLAVRRKLFLTSPKQWMSLSNRGLYKESRRMSAVVFPYFETQVARRKNVIIETAIESPTE
jgi:hypothetical protein